MPFAYRKIDHLFLVALEIIGFVLAGVSIQLFANLIDVSSSKKDYEFSSSQIRVIGLSALTFAVLTVVSYYIRNLKAGFINILCVALLGSIVLAVLDRVILSNNSPNMQVWFQDIIGVFLITLIPNLFFPIACHSLGVLILGLKQRFVEREGT